MSYGTWLVTLLASTVAEKRKGGRGKVSGRGKRKGVRKREEERCQREEERCQEPILTMGDGGG
jgi:hypothetical protein